nr:hypothetical protein [Tanacetum cinerariifolium]
RAEIPEADTPPRKKLLLTAPRPGYEVEESFAAAAARQPGPTMTRSVDHSFIDTMETRFRDTERRMMTALEMVNMRFSYQRLAYEQESIQIREALAGSEAYSRTLQARVAMLETQARRHEWQRQTADDFVVQHIMRTQALRLEHALTHWRTLVVVPRLGVAAAMAEVEASRVRNGYDSNGSG